MTNPCAHLGQPTAPYTIGTATIGPFVCPWCEIERKNSLIDLQDEAQTSLHAENVRLRTALNDITECCEYRDGGHGIQVIEGQGHPFWSAIRAAKRITHTHEPLPVASFPVHADPTGTTREPPHCPTCECGMCGCPDEYCLKLAGSLKPGIRCADDLEQAMKLPEQP